MKSRENQMILHIGTSHSFKVLCLSTSKLCYVDFLRVCELDTKESYILTGPACYPSLYTWIYIEINCIVRWKLPNDP